MWDRPVVRRWVVVDWLAEVDQVESAVDRHQEAILAAAIDRTSAAATDLAWVAALAIGQAWRTSIDRRPYPARSIDLAEFDPVAALIGPATAQESVIAPASVIGQGDREPAIDHRLAIVPVEIVPAETGRGLAIALAIDPASAIVPSAQADVRESSLPEIAPLLVAVVIGLDGRIARAGGAATTSTSAAATSSATGRAGTMVVGTTLAGVGEAAGLATGTTTASARTTVGTTAAGMAIGGATGTGPWHGPRSAGALAPGRAVGDMARAITTRTTRRRLRPRRSPTITLNPWS